jgi:hypothetical protein
MLWEQGYACSYQFRIDDFREIYSLVKINELHAQKPANVKIIEPELLIARTITSDDDVDH